MTEQNAREAMDVWWDARNASATVTDGFDWDYATDASRGKLIGDADQAAAAVIAAKLAEKDAEIARKDEALLVLANLPIVENDNPDTLHLDGAAHTGPAVDYLFRIVRKIKEVANQALTRKDA